LLAMLMTRRALLECCFVWDRAPSLGCLTSRKWWHSHDVRRKILQLGVEPVKEYGLLDH
jgi:hypothetical protein